MTSTYGYDSDTQTCRLFNRDEENAVGFTTRKLNLYEGNNRQSVSTICVPAGNEWESIQCSLPGGRA